jgi:hypothetical protein
MAARLWRGGVVAVLALWAAPALAQDDTRGTDTSIAADELRERQGTGFDTLGVAVRGGLSSYTGSLGGTTNAGAFLGVQADVQAMRWAGVEFGYEGSFNNLVGGNESGSLWRHNVGALAKVGPVINSVRPFVGAGFGVSYIDPTREATSLGYDEDVITEVPLAAGVDYQVGDLMVGARATFRLLAGEEFGPVDDGNLFNAGVSLGGRF